MYLPTNHRTNFKLIGHLISLIPFKESTWSRWYRIGVLEAVTIHIIFLEGQKISKNIPVLFEIDSNVEIKWEIRSNIELYVGVGT